MQKILAVDFDGTLCVEAFPDAGKRRLIHKLVAWYVIRKQKQGWIIILNTLRHHMNEKYPHAEDLAIFACAKWGIVLTYINDNLPELTKKYGYARKIKADIYLDDANIGLLGWLLRISNK